MFRCIPAVEYFPIDVVMMMRCKSIQTKRQQGILVRCFGDFLVF